MLRHQGCFDGSQYGIYTDVMSTVAERLREESRERLRRMTPAARLAEALELGEDDLPPFSSTTRKQKIHETWPSCNASTSKLSGC